MRGLAGALAALWMAVAGCGQGSWYQLQPDADQRYLPLGDVPYAVTTLTADGDVVDVYHPTDRRAPIVVFLPGAAVVKERYRWVGVTLASNGVAVAIPQPPGSFARSHETSATLAALTAADADAASPLHGLVDRTRVVLAGHSAGTVVQAGLTYVPGCPAGFCDADAARPAGLRGLMLLAFHYQNDANDTAPMPAAEVPWLVVTGSRDGLTTPEKAQATFARLQDRPVELVEVQGMSHYQMTEWVDPAHDVALPEDLRPSIGNQAARATAARYLVRFARRVLLDDAAVAPDLAAAADGAVKMTFAPERSAAPASSLPRLLAAPFGPAGLGGNGNDAEVVASCEHDGAMYLLARNDSDGAELWRIRGGALEQLPLPPNARLNSVLGALASWNGQLYIGLSSGIQGNRRGSTGAELWRFDGSAFVPLVSSRVDDDPKLTVAAVDGCGAATARLSLTGGSFAPGTLRGATLDDAESETAPDVTVLEVLDNDATSVTVRAGELASGADVVACDHLAAGAKLRLRQGTDESGFGQPWNKAITAIEPFGGRLYVATGLNLRDGAEVWSSDDGVHFAVAVPRSFWGTHDTGAPITSSVTALRALTVGGTTALWLGANGTDNYGDRLAVLDAPAAAPRLVVDGGGANYQVTGLATFADRLWYSTFNFGGLELRSTAQPGGSDWSVAVGQGGALAGGFGDGMQFFGRTFVVDGQLWVATVANIATRSDLKESSGELWRSADGQSWQRVTAHAFGVNSVAVTSLFAFDGALYAAVGNGALAARGSFAPVQLYRLTEEQF